MLGLLPFRDQNASTVTSQHPIRKETIIGIKQLVCGLCSPALGQERWTPSILSPCGDSLRWTHNLRVTVQGSFSFQAQPPNSEVHHLGIWSQLTIITGSSSPQHSQLKMTSQEGTGTQRCILGLAFQPHLSLSQLKRLAVLVERRVKKLPQTSLGAGGTARRDLGAHAGLGRTTNLNCSSGSLVISQSLFIMGQEGTGDVTIDLGKNTKPQSFGLRE